MPRRLGLLQEVTGSKIRCNVCEIRCTLGEGRLGVCGTRENIGGSIVSTVYGDVSAIGVDPIEKKPVYHYRPGTSVLTLGTIGCNLLCNHCQNWVIAYQNARNAPLGSLETLFPADAVAVARAQRADAIGWSFNDPSIWLEYVLDTARLAVDAGLYTVLCTNGYGTPEANAMLLPYVSVLRLDLKGFRDDFYRRLTRVGRLAPVLATAAAAREAGCHVEVVTVLIPGENDSDAEVNDAAAWIEKRLGPTTPWHLTRFVPHARWLTHEPSTREQLLRAAAIARDAGLQYVYVGGFPGNGDETTFCRVCGAALVSRRSASFDPVGLRADTCASCGTPAPFVGAAARSAQMEASASSRLVHA